VINSFFPSSSIRRVYVPLVAAGIRSPGARFASAWKET
jgi:hypothetical protein